MRLLFLTPYLPSPPRWGGPRRIHGLLSGLARSHSVSVLALVAADEDPGVSLRATQEYCDEVFVVVDTERSALKGREKRALQLRSLISPRSYEHLVYHRPAFQSALDRVTIRKSYDIITAECAFMAHYRVRRGPKWVVDELNIAYDVLHRIALAERG